MPTIAPFPQLRLYAVTPEGDEVPDFLPWKPERRRANGWTTHDQRLFIHELTRCGSVGMAAKSVGKSARSAYALRDKLGAESFAAAWVRAIRTGIEKIRLHLSDRFMEGDLIPRFYHGRIIGHVRKYNDRAVLAVLQSLNRVTHEDEEDQLIITRFGAKPDEIWYGHDTTLQDYRTRLENWEGSLRAREYKLDWDIGQRDEDEAAWQRDQWNREWARQERADQRAAIRTQVKAERVRLKQDEDERESEMRNDEPNAGPRIRFL